MVRRAAVPPPIPSLSVRAAQNAILGSAIGVFGKLGFAVTRVEDLLEAAGIARRTFYKYFGSKEDVLTGIYELTTRELLHALHQAMEMGGDPADGIRRVMDSYLDFHVQNATLVRVLVEQAIRTDSPLAPLRKRFRDELVELLRRAAVIRGDRPIDPLLGIALISALEGVSLEILERGASARDVAQAKKTMHALLARVFSTKPGA
jgi:AcrR family transcriptional regulator